MPRLLRTESDIRQFVAEVLESGATWIALDTETIGVSDPGIPVLKKNALILDRARAFLITLYHPATGPVGVFTHFSKMPGALLASKVVSALLPIFRELKIVCHNANYDINVLLNHGVRVADYDCTMIKSHSGDEERPKGLKQLAQMVGMLLRETKAIDLNDPDDALEYGCDDVVATGRLYQAFTTGRYYDHEDRCQVQVPELRLHAKRQMYYYREIEKPILGIFIEAERRGFRIDVDFFRQMEAQMSLRISDLELEAYRLVGRPFNLSSVPQLREILFSQLGLNPIRATKTGNSVDEYTLVMLRDQHPLCELLLSYREVNKLLGTYVRAESGIPAMADRYGFLHASMNTVGAKTGRFAVTLPALQTIPKRAKEWPIRKGFISRDGHSLVAVDYDRMEMVLMANFCGDPVLIQTIREGGDVHQVTADTVGCTRDEAKVLNFALIYGCSARRLMEQLQSAGIAITLEEAKHYRARFFGLYRRILPFREALFAWHRQHGYITLLNGKIRTVPNMTSTSDSLRAEAERICGNSIIQASAAQYIKEATIRLVRRDDFRATGAHILLQVHDELLMEAPDDSAEEAKRIAEEELARPPAITTFPIKAPLSASGKIGKNWGEMN